jgi:hypothetical protein
MVQEPLIGNGNPTDKEDHEQIKVMIVISVYLLCLAAFIFILFLMDFGEFGDASSISFVIGLLIMGTMILYLSLKELQGKSTSKRGNVIGFLVILIVFTFLFTPISLESIYGHLGYPICFSGVFLILLGISGVCLIIARIITYALEPMNNGS